MGFFNSDAVIEAAVKQAPAMRKIKRQELDSNAVGCDNCSLKDRWPQLLSPKMKLSGSREADILVLGEGPGEEEDEQGEQFVGASGKMLRNLIPRRHADRIAYQNAVRCRPPENRNPTRHELHACNLYLESDADSLQLKAVLGVGGVPLSKFISDTSITRIHGTRFPIKLGQQVCWYYPVLHPSFLLRNGGERSPAMPVLEADMRKFFREVDRWGKPAIFDLKPSDVVCVYDEAEAYALADKLDDLVGIDFETTRLQPYWADSKVLTAALSDGVTTFAFPVEHPEAPNSWGWKLIERIVSTKRWIAHNSAFELAWIWHHMGRFDWVPGKFEDSMALGRIYHERETLLSLGNLSRIHLGIDVKKLTNVNAANIMAYPLSDILPYNGLDALASVLIYEMLVDKVDKWQVQKLLDTELSCTAMQLQGLPIDLEINKTLYERFDGERKKAELAAKELYEVKQFEIDRGVEFNIGSPEHVAEALVKYGRCKLPKTAKSEEQGGNKYSTEDKVLRDLAEKNPLAARVQDYRGSSILVSTFLEGIYSGKLIAPDGFIHPGYTVMMTRTLRLSSEDPNIQNWPKRKHREIRGQVVAPPGHIILSVDEGQLEARVMAMASKDRWLCEAIITGYDIHADWRDRLIKLYPAYLDRLAEKSGETDEKKILKAGRDQIKNDFVFASFFGSSATSCANYTGVPLFKMEELALDFWTTFSGVKEWIKARRAEYRSTGGISTLTGRRRSSILWGNECINTPIQGTAADLVLCAQNELAEIALREKDPYIMPRLNVHDDLTFILPDSESKIDEYLKIITDAMTRLRFDFMVVPLMAEAKVGYDWADMEEICKVTGKYHR